MSHKSWKCTKCRKSGKFELPDGSLQVATFTLSYDAHLAVARGCPGEVVVSDCAPTRNFRSPVKSLKPAPKRTQQIAGTANKPTSARKGTKVKTVVSYWHCLFCKKTRELRISEAMSEVDKANAGFANHEAVSPSCNGVAIYLAELPKKPNTPVNKRILAGLPIAA